jgi:hypothetical protein
MEKVSTSLLSLARVTFPKRMDTRLGDISMAGGEPSVDE